MFERLLSRWRQRRGVTALNRTDGFSQFVWLVAVLVAITLLGQLSLGRFILSPFRVLSVWIHEMGHGFTGILVGCEFEKLRIEGSARGGLVGLAYNLCPSDMGRIRSALLSAGGPMGPAIAGGLMIMASRRVGSTQIALVVLGALLLVSCLIWIRSLFGWVYGIGFGGVIIVIGVFGNVWFQTLSLRFLGVKTWLSMFEQWDYLMRDKVGGSLHSDTGEISNQLFLPHWFWAIAIIVSALIILAASVRYVFRD